MGVKKILVAVHTRPDIDCFFPTALLATFGKVKISGYYFQASGDELIQIKIKGGRVIDRGRIDLDHHGRQEKTTSTYLTARELGLSKEKWIQPILNYVQRVDLQGQSQPFDIAEIGKALAHEGSIEDKKRMELGKRMAEDILEFHQKSLSRDNLFVQKVMEEFIRENFPEKSPPRWQKYLNQLLNPRFERPCDLVEIAVGEKVKRGEKESQKFIKELLKYLLSDFKRYLTSQREFKAAQKIVIGPTFIVIGESDNPKFNTIARKEGAIAVIQKNSSGHVQIFFDYKRIQSVITDNIIAKLRKREMEIAGISLKGWKNKFSYLSQPETIEECPQWYYFIGKKGGIIILNGSLTTPGKLPTKIALAEIVAIVKTSLQPKIWRTATNKKAEGA